MESSEIYDQVNKRYGSAVRSKTGQYEQTVATAFGYTEEELTDVPEGANLGLSCGNPFAIANLREGETVLDFGSGAGFDVFAAAKKVGQTGKAIGIDMNKNMIEKANAIKAKTSASNVEFVESAITSIPLPGDSADCIISNCVINLVPAAEKQLAFNEMFRLLKPGGRVAISDILARKEFTEDIRKNAALYVGCVAGASQVSEYEAFLKNAGFRDAVIVDSKSDLNVYFTAADGTTSCCAPPGDGASCCAPAPDATSCCAPAKDATSCCGVADEAKKLASHGITDFNEWAGSFKVYAVKPSSD
ncbi:related to arsenic methyltransferase Cyt19 [Cephalotrichum gorgonifer]|uniref:Arsenite methyltransferase n=1 Tax=Cephalotrichum gorgonifer TaxID=2041049 RepID=A0AAE8SYT2_9PEZI|nr:related to arsenic methyltransferase Cyt19 [Cephalotrichum gorgonifer]